MSPQGSSCFFIFSWRLLHLPKQCFQVFPTLSKPSTRSLIPQKMILLLMHCKTSLNPTSSPLFCLSRENVFPHFSKVDSSIEFLLLGLARRCDTPVVGRIMPLEEHPDPNPRNLWICYLFYTVKGTLQMWVRDIEVGRCPELSGWAQWSHNHTYERKGEVEASESEKQIWWLKPRSEWCGAANRGVSGSLERQENEFFSRRTVILLTSDVSSETHLGYLPSQTVK